MRKVLIGIAILFAALVAVVILIRVFIPPVNPAQQAPDKHFRGPCWACHIVTESAKIQQPEIAD